MVRRCGAVAWLGLIACGVGTSPSADVSSSRGEVADVSAPHGRAGEACPCESGLGCHTVRGSPLCLPDSWYTGQVGGFCSSRSDCGAGLDCDTAQAPNPFTDGVCVVATGG